MKETENSVGTDENDLPGLPGKAVLLTSWTANLENDASKVEGRPFKWENKWTFSCWIFEGCDAHQAKGGGLPNRGSGTYKPAVSLDGVEGYVAGYRWKAGWVGRRGKKSGRTRPDCRISLCHTLWKQWFSHLSMHQRRLEMKTQIAGPLLESFWFSRSGWGLETCISFLFLFFNWSIIDLQYCVSFRYTAKWFSIHKHIFFFRFFSIIGYCKILK